MNINTDITVNQIIESSIYFTATVSTFWIAKKCIPLLEYLTEKEVWLFSVGLVGLHVLFTFVTRTFAGDSSRFKESIGCRSGGIGKERKERKKERKNKEI